MQTKNPFIFIWKWLDGAPYIDKCHRCKRDSMRRQNKIHSRPKQYSQLGLCVLLAFMISFSCFGP